ncbi:MAG TPA: cation-translocating P-type ATPase [Candidatus Saccharimonadales bacterium]|nr:cation-translocating P-type ATPase [Candidatus Saccharimonadales bacterium]
MDSGHKPLSTSQAKTLQKQFGLNEITTAARRTIVEMFLSQFISIFIVILFAAAFFSFIVGDILDGSFIVGIVILNSFLGFFQEYKAEKAVEKLTQQSVFLTRVIRDGQEQTIDNRELVPGDIIKLEAGNKVPADATLLETVNLEVDEAILTGESVPVYKHPSDAQTKEIFMGTIVIKGRGTAVVTETGMRTRFGKLAKTLATIQEPPTNLSKYILHLGKQLSILGVGVGIIIFIIPLYHHQPVFVTILTSISLVVAVVPEGLPTIIIIALATGASRMAKKNVIIRKMAAIETLGEVSIIATDKTGTLTQNKMEVKKIWMDNITYSTYKEFPAKINKTFKKFLEISILCNNAQLFYKKDSPLEIVGDQTEGALLILAEKVHINPDEMKKEWQVVDEFSFADATKTMTVVAKQNDKTIAFTKGAPENVLAMSTKIYRNGAMQNMSMKEISNIQAAYEEYAQDGLRLIGLAYKDLPGNEKKYKREEVESGLVFVGFVGIADPVRAEVKDALEVTRNAGIKSIMITGDNELTARTIAIETGLIQKGEVVMTAKQLDTLSEEELFSVIEKVRVFARCTPDHKLRIVKAYQQQKHVVAVTGDGINDAPCLKQANVGIAMGITGTDVTREAADVVITDDNFATIVAGIEEGRVIFDNIIKSISYLLAGNLSEILVIGIAIICGLPSPLLPVHILWMNVVTDSLPAIALALDTKHPRIMKRPPANPASSLISGKKFLQIGMLSLLISLITLFTYWSILRGGNLLLARNTAFTLLISLQMVLAFLMKDRHTWYTNTLLFIAVILALLSQVIILTVPFFQTIFHITL